MSAPKVSPAGAATPSTPSGGGGLVALPSEIVRLPQELAARLLGGLRTVLVSGTVTGTAADGALQVRSQFGEISVRAGTPVPADRQVSLQIPPLTGKAATLTPALLSRNPIPANLLLSKPTAAPPGPDAPGSTTGSPPRPGVPPAPGPAAQSTQAASQAPMATPSTATSLPNAQAGGAGQLPQATSGPATPTGSPVPRAATPSPNPAGVPAPSARSTIPPASPSPVPTPASNARPTAPAAGSEGPPAPPLGRLSLAAQLLTQTGAPPSIGTPAIPGQTAAPQPQSTAPQIAVPQGTAPPASTTAPANLDSSQSAKPFADIGGAARGTATVPQGSASPPGAGRESVPIESVRRVPALREAVSVLSAADPTLATQFVRSVLPQANTQLAATLLFFLSATRAGDIRGWVGDRVTSALNDAGRSDLLPKLSAELAAPARPAPEPAGEWRSQTMPLYQDGDIGGMVLHVRRQGKEDVATADGEPVGRRFLIDMDLSRMGPLQFDGTIRERRLDLTIRSKAAFPEPMRQDMRRLFRGASDAVGLHGGLTFQAGGHDWTSVATSRAG